ncbi:MAG: Rv0623 family protein transcription factor [Bryobacterales bacterium]|nr:Rv0623 family protein transcription factor [Bryobacterales bacterium]
MALNIKNSEVERLAGEVAALARESKTEAIRRALLDRKERLQVSPRSGTRAERLESLLRHRIWPQVPADVLGHSISKQEEEEILGFGPDGV